MDYMDYMDYFKQITHKMKKYKHKLLKTRKEKVKEINKISQELINYFWNLDREKRKICRNKLIYKKETEEYDNFRIKLSCLIDYAETMLTFQEWKEYDEEKRIKRMEDSLK